MTLMSLSFGYDGEVFTPSRLTLARRRRGYTKKRVAELARLTPRIIVAYEAGERDPSPKTLTTLADVLRFPVAFFEGDDLEQVADEAASFRSLSKTAVGRRYAALAAGELAFELQDWISARFSLPAPDVPQLGPGEVDPETAAQVVRAEWRLGQKPAPNLVHLLEAHGVRVFSLAEECYDVDAFSLWRGGEQPYVFLNTQKSGERSRFDAAHELGHLVMHWHHDGPQGREAEQQANRFAAAFLMPGASITSTVPRSPSLDQIIRAKQPWRVSVAAFTHRLHQLGALSDWHYRMLYMEIGRRGYRTNEPNGIQRETSQILNKVFAALRKESITKADVARTLRLHSPDLDALVFGLAMLPARSPSGSETSLPTPPPRPRELRLV